ncbi:rhomboid family intramembrane serine protease [Desulfonatronum lacustre]|uniref:rhomboid family intramembrane serine protease n=1 Tax=Desulfonatronum lacustre TaxID=66849 RepID=UPI0004AECC5E|nr:rhomboid family intramembrane serine protease [Desulfonatronum lacustre]
MNDFTAQDEPRSLWDNLTSHQADRYALVLAAAGIPYRFRRSGWGWTLEVLERDVSRAVTEIEQFNLENPLLEDHRQRPAPFLPPPPQTLTGAAAALLLLVFHLVTSRNGAHEAMIMEAGAHAARILEGEYWRTVTALTLHADARHLAGNMLGIAVFGTLLCRRVGVGAAWLLIVLAGAGGNLLNAWLHQTGFLSIGASTAVFAAVGLLGGVRVFPMEGAEYSGPRSWLLPVGAAFGLLAMLGSDVQTDIGAHLMGCVVGFVLGIAYTLMGPRHVSETRQNHLLLVALAVIAGSWWLVLEGS